MKDEIIKILNAALEDDGYRSEYTWEDGCIDQLQHDLDRLKDAAEQIIEMVDSRPERKVYTLHEVYLNGDGYDENDVIGVYADIDTPLSKAKEKMLEIYGNGRRIGYYGDIPKEDIVTENGKPLIKEEREENDIALYYKVIDDDDYEYEDLMFFIREWEV